MARAHRLGTPGCSARRTYERGVKPFGSTVKKEVRNEVESWEKIWGYVAGVGEFENEGKKPQGQRERVQKIFEKVFLKILKKRMFWKYLRGECWCRRDEWYIVLRNVGRSEQRGVVCRPPS